MVQYKPRVIVMDLNRVPDIEYSALQMIEEGERCRTEQGVTVWLAGLNPGVLEVIRHAGMDVRLGRERLLFSAQVAIERYLKLSPELAVTPAVTSKS
ncbi:sodium-independent anion transporter [Microvirga sp. P5_D2]